MFNKPAKYIYDWALHWANTPYGNIALILMAFAESSFFPIPPDVLLIALIIALNEKTVVNIGLPILENKSFLEKIRLISIFFKNVLLFILKNLIKLLKTFPSGKAFKYALHCSIASVFGGCFGYLIGKFLWYSGDDFSGLAVFFFNHIPGFTTDLFDKIKLWYANYDFWIIFIAGFTPIPYKIFTIAAGVCKINIFTFIIASVISRSARFFLVSFILWLFGPKIKEFIDKYFNILTVIFMILLVLGFAVVKLLA